MGQLDGATLEAFRKDGVAVLRNVVDGAWRAKLAEAIQEMRLLCPTRTIRIEGSMRANLVRKRGQLVEVSPLPFPELAQGRGEVGDPD